MVAKVLLSNLSMILLLIGCAAQSSKTETTNASPSTEQTSQPTTPPPSDSSSREPLANVTNVEVSGNSGAYTFAVTIESPDTGCDTYANWWEVLTPEGELLYRRILAHSHVDEQPFTRSGGPIAAEADQPVIVRVHMAPTGYSPEAMQGLPGKALAPITLDPDFALNLAGLEPLPASCAF